MDWDDLRFFLAVARGGTLSRAARALGVAQPTVGRRITSFEKRLGARLFDRSDAGLTVSDAGRSVLAHAEAMEEHALGAQIVASGRDSGVTGRVVVTASEWLIASVIGPFLGPLLFAHPGLELVLSADPRHLSLVRREADIALRPSRFTHQDVHQREIAVLEFALYASPAYLEQRGAPDFGRGAPGHAVIAMTEDMKTIVDVEWLPALVSRARTAVRTNGRVPMAQMAAAGVGLACLPRLVGDATPGLVLVPTPSSHPRRQLWLGVHRSSRTVPRVRTTLEFLAERFAQFKTPR